MGSFSQEKNENLLRHLRAFSFPRYPLLSFALPVLILRHAQVFSIPCSYCTRKDYDDYDFDYGFILRHDVTNR